jgi:hypothetical protein
MNPIATAHYHEILKDYYDNTAYADAFITAYVYQDLIIYQFNVDAQRGRDQYSYECKCFVCPELDIDQKVNVFCWDVSGVVHNLDKQYNTSYMYVNSAHGCEATNWLPFLQMLIQKRMFSEGFFMENSLLLEDIEIVPLVPHKVDRFQKINRHRIITESILSLRGAFPEDICRVIGEKQETPNWLRFLSMFAMCGSKTCIPTTSCNHFLYLDYKHRFSRSRYLLQKAQEIPLPECYKRFPGSPFLFRHLYSTKPRSVETIKIDQKHPGYHYVIPVPIPVPMPEPEPDSIFDEEQELDDDNIHVDDIDAYDSDVLLVRAKRRQSKKLKRIHPIKDILKHPCGAVSRSYVK